MGVDPNKALTIDVRGAGVIVGGELDELTAPKLVEALELFAGRSVDLDMAAITFIDSSGIRTLLRAKSSGIDLVIVDPSHNVHRVLELVGLLDHFGLK